MTNESNENGTNQAMVDYTAKLNAVDNMSVSQLQRCFFEISGEITNSRNKKSLKKRVARMLQEAIDDAANDNLDENTETDCQEEQCWEVDENDTEEVPSEESNNISETDAVEITDNNENDALAEESDNGNEELVDIQSEEKEETAETSLETAQDEVGHLEPLQDIEVDQDQEPDSEAEPTTEPTPENDPEEGSSDDNAQSVDLPDETFPEAATENEGTTTTTDSDETSVEQDEQETESAVDHVIKVAETRPRDPRLPDPGTVIVKSHKGIDHEVTVLEKGFSYEGAHYRSLSALAKKISGTVWNGYSFFGLSKRVSRREEEDAA